MNVFKLIQAIEQLIFEVACLLVFVPLTFFRTLVFPHRIQPYVMAELARAEEERFADRTVPALYWGIIGVLSAFVLLMVLRMSEFFPEIDEIIPQGLSHEATIWHLAVILVSGPVAFASGTLLAARKRLTREAIRPAFYMQCYIFATVQFIAVVGLLLWVADVWNDIIAGMTAGYGGGSPRGILERHLGTFAVVLLIVAIAWFVAAQGFALWKGLSNSTPKWRSTLHVSLAVVLSIAVWAAITSSWVFLSRSYTEALHQLKPAESESATHDG